MAEKDKAASKNEQAEGQDKGGPAKGGVKSEDTPTSETNETEAAERADLTEGDVKALRDDAGLNQLPGHQANIAAWENSEAGKKFLDEEKDRVQAEKDAEKKFEADREEAEKPVVEYQEAVGEPAQNA